jgi:tetratricopeptide (TPR) repeat protein
MGLIQVNQMLKRILFIAGAFALYLGAPVTHELGVTGVSAHAEEEAVRETRRIPAMSEASFKRLAEAQEAMEAKNFNQARQILNDMIARGRLNGNELGQVHNILGFLYFSEEKYRDAINHYKQVLAQGENIPEGLEVQTMYTLAQLSFVNEDYQAALNYMEQWRRKAQNPGHDPHIFMGQVYYQMQNFRAATEQIETGIRIARERGVELKEQWWALLNFLYFEQENWPKVLETLEILVRDFPKREYWIRLAGIHGQIGDDQKSLCSYEAADAGGYLQQSGDFTNYAGLLMQAEVPWRAARVLEKAIEANIVERNDRNLQSLGQAWQLSQETEKAIPVFQQAARMSDDGKIYERLAQLYLDNDNYPECISAANNALQKRGLRQQNVMYIVRGMCQFNQDSLTDARESFVQCRNESQRLNDQSNQRMCAQWITYIDRESERRETLRRQAQAAN